MLVVGLVRLNKHHIRSTYVRESLLDQTLTFKGVENAHIHYQVMSAEKEVGMDGNFPIHKAVVWGKDALRRSSIGSN